MNCRSLFTLAASLSALLCTTPTLAADVGSLVNILQQGFYGRIDIGSVSPPRLIYQQPVLIEPVPVAQIQRPIYLRVPPGHAKDWSKHCGRYNACRQQTYFVQEDWYQTVYAPAQGHGRYDDRNRGKARPGHSKNRQRHDDDHGSRKHGNRKHSSRDKGKD